MKFSTRAIHDGYSPDPLYGAVMPPVYQTSTFAFKDVEDPGEFDYSRSGNPSRKALETCLASLENGTAAYTFASGMAAESTVAMLFDAGSHIILSDECYGGTYRMMKLVMEKHGLEVELVDLQNLDAVQAAIRPNTRALWIETPTNPLMKVVDLAALAAIAKAHNVCSVCDNTFLSPYFQNPLDFGIDLVVHSTTKYINGHSDVIGGAVVVKDPELAQRVYYLQNALGAVPAPWDCFLILRGIKTLALRMEAHNASALGVAQWLEAHPKIERVLHPGLPSHPQYELSKRQARGFGGTFSFYPKGGVAEAHALLRNLKLFSQAVSLGGVESLIEHPWTMTHVSMPEEARRKMGISESLIRVSIGLEDAEDIKADLAAALDTL